MSQDLPNRLPLEPFEGLSAELTHDDHLSLTLHLMGLLQQLEFEAKVSPERLPVILAKIVDFEILDIPLHKEALADARVFVDRNSGALILPMEVMKKEGQWAISRQLWTAYHKELSVHQNLEHAGLADTRDCETMSLGEAAYLAARFPENRDLHQKIWAQKERLGQEATAVCQKFLIENTLSRVVNPLRTSLGLPDGAYLDLQSHCPGELSEISAAVRDMRVITTVGSKKRGLDPWFCDHGAVALLKKEHLKTWRSRGWSQIGESDLLKLLADQVCMNS